MAVDYKTLTFDGKPRKTIGIDVGAFWKNRSDAQKYRVNFEKHLFLYSENAIKFEAAITPEMEEKLLSDISFMEGAKIGDFSVGEQLDFFDRPEVYFYFGCRHTFNLNLLNEFQNGLTTKLITAFEELKANCE